MTGTAPARGWPGDRHTACCSNASGLPWEGAPLGSAIYTALIDSVLVQQTLHADPFSYNEPGAFQSSNFAPLNWGTPIPSAPGPAVATMTLLGLGVLALRRRASAL